jgi:hypothetical protein
MIRIKLLSILLSEPGHFKITQCETALLDNINYFSNIHVAVWLDHGECSLIINLGTFLFIFRIWIW